MSSAGVPASVPSGSIATSRGVVTRDPRASSSAAASRCGASGSSASQSGRTKRRSEAMAPTVARDDVEGMDGGGGSAVERPDDECAGPTTERGLHPSQRARRRRAAEDGRVFGRRLKSVGRGVAVLHCLLLSRVLRNGRSTAKEAHAHPDLAIQETKPRRTRPFVGESGSADRDSVGDSLSNVSQARRRCYSGGG
jgi:hypothetical protein